MTTTTCDQAEVVGTLLFRLMRSLGAAENGEMRCCGVTTGQGLALVSLKAPGRVTMRRLAETLGVSPGTATRVVDNLVRDGMVERTASPTDRRLVCVRPTPQGEEKIEELDKCYRRFWEGVLAALPQERRQAAVAALDVLVDAVEKTRAACCPTSREEAQR